jgi:uncharacterized protein YdhG (YjbR/CyaY superfamily)
VRKQKAATVAEYIAAAPKAAQPMLRQLRQTIRAAAPGAEERLSYGMPYYAYHGRLAYFAAFTAHVSYYVMPSRTVQEKFAEAILPYRTGKATLQFPIGTKLPLALIAKLVKARAAENLAKARKK